MRQIFHHIEAGATALLGRDHPQIFAIYSIEFSRWHLYDIPTQVLPVIRQSAVTFTTTGRNVVFLRLHRFTEKRKSSGRA